MLLTLVYFILALLILVVVHELGHFLVARWCGVKVLRFSFGFGKVLARWSDRRGTEYVWSLLPLGGYVKMLDETEGKVPKEERDFAFNRQALWKRVCIVLAGPLFNLLLAFFALWFMWMIGIKTLAPIIDGVIPASIAERSGLKAEEEIVAFAGKPITSWRDFQYALIPFLGSNETVPMTVKLPKTASQKQVHLFLEHWILDTESPDVLKSLGIKPFIPTVPPVIGEVVHPSPAYSAGLQQQDVIVSINDQPLSDWLMLVEFVKQHPNNLLKLTLRRQGRLQDVAVRIGEVEQKGVKQGFLGVRSQSVKWPENWLRIQRLSPIQAAQTAWTETVDLTVATFKLIGRFITGKLSVKNISGPVGIAQGAGDSARNGLAHYLAFLALISISLGVLNVLPIPMLDGGHLLYYLIEWIRRRPLSEDAKSMGMYFGMVLLVVLMLIALGNDVARLLE